MGAAESTSSLRDVEIGEEVSRSTTLYRIWSNVYPCVLGKKRKCTLLQRHFAETDSKETRSFFENGIKTVLKLRHPYIVEYVDSKISLKEASLLTERVQVLDLALDSLSPIEIHTGLTHILDALIFLHDKAGLSHNNICPSSIFISLDGRWKLSGFECAQKLENSRHWVQSDFVRSVKLPEFAPAEDQLMLSTDIPPAARDAFAFGKLIAYVLPYMKDHLLEETIVALEDVVKRLTDDDPSHRGELGSLAAAFPAAFTNKLSTMMDFLRHFHSKSPDERRSFFEDAASDLKEMPKDVVGKRLIPLLLSRYVLLDKSAHSKLLPYVLQPDEENRGSGLFNQESFRRWVAPQLLRIFRVHETSVRLALLSHFSQFVGAIEDADLEDAILPELILGTKDTDDLVVSASLRAMADLVIILGGPVVTGLDHKKIFADGKPKGECRSANVKNESWKSQTTTESQSESEVMPSSLSRLLEEEHSEFPEVTLKLVRDESPLSTVSKELGEKTVAAAASGDWDDGWESMEETVDSTEYGTAHGTPQPTVSSKIETVQKTEKEPDTAVRRNSAVIGVGYGIPEIGKIKRKEVDEFVEPDYFADMEPVVSSAPSLVIRLSDGTAKTKGAADAAQKKSVSTRFAATVLDEEAADFGSWDAGPVADWDAD